MFLFEIGLLNGFTVDILDEEKRNPMAKLIELEGDRVNMYYDQVLWNTIVEFENSNKLHYFGHNKFEFIFKI